MQCASYFKDRSHGCLNLPTVEGGEHVRTTALKTELFMTLTLRRTAGGGTNGVGGPQFPPSSFSSAREKANPLKCARSQVEVIVRSDLKSLD